MKEFKNICLFETDTIRLAMRRIEENDLKTCVVTDKLGMMVGTVTDGDIRRGLLNNSDMDDDISNIMFKNPTFSYFDDPREKSLEKIQDKDLKILPIVDKNKKLLGIETLDYVLENRRSDMNVFLMAGGFGKRIRPLTENMPKPMLKVGDVPVIERIIDRFKKFGFYKFYISTHYLPEKIMSYLGEGEDKGVDIQYLHEKKPLGTAGALSLLPRDFDLPVVIYNGDILCDINFSQLSQIHLNKQNHMTVVVRELEHKIPYGVIEDDGSLISNIVEKPTIRNKISTGIYVLNPEALKFLKKEAHIDMPELIQKFIEKDLKVGFYVHHGYWLDIGRIEDFKRAEQDIKFLDI